MVDSWAGKFNAAVRCQDFLGNGPIMLFGLRALQRLDVERDQVDDYMAHLASVHPVPDTNSFFLDYD